MKKTLLILVAIVFAATACNKQTYVDGTYHVTFDTLDSHGWNAFVEFTLVGDEITDVDFDYLDIDGLRKSEDTAYASRMYPVAGTSPDLYCPQIESAIMNTTIIPDYVDIDVVTGATSSTGNANELMAAGLESAVEGSTDVVLTQED